MARILITGSADGLGSLAAKRLVAAGHQVVLHARNSQRAEAATSACPGSEAVLIADLTSMEETKKMAAEANSIGTFDAVLHNAGLYTGHEAKFGKEGLSHLFAVNTVAPYILTCKMNMPKRLVYVSSGLHQSGRSLSDIAKAKYSDSKLQMIMMAKAFAARFPSVESNAVDPGWVPTKMGGQSATGNLDAAVESWIMLALGEGAAKGQSGKYFFNAGETKCNPLANDVADQDRLLASLAKISGIEVPKSD